MPGKRKAAGIYGKWEDQKVPKGCKDKNCCKGKVSESEWKARKRPRNKQWWSKNRCCDESKNCCWIKNCNHQTKCKESDLILYGKIEKKFCRMSNMFTHVLVNFFGKFVFTNYVHCFVETRFKCKKCRTFGNATLEYSGCDGAILRFGKYNNTSVFVIEDSKTNYEIESVDCLHKIKNK